MGFKHFRYARRVDADTIGLYHDDMTKMFSLDKATTNTSRLTGNDLTGKILELKATAANARPLIRMTGNSALLLAAQTQIDFTVASLIARMVATGGGASFHIKESTTPTAIADFGAIYTKADNHLYFQDGAGAEHDMGSP